MNGEDSFSDKPYCPGGYCAGTLEGCTLCKEYDSRWNKAFAVDVLVRVVWLALVIYLFIINSFIYLLFVVPSAIILWKLERKWWKKIMGKYYNAFKK
jgi:hypothetical protein